MSQENSTHGTPESDNSKPNLQLTAGLGEEKGGKSVPPPRHKEELTDEEQQALIQDIYEGLSHVYDETLVIGKDLSSVSTKTVEGFQGLYQEIHNHTEEVRKQNKQLKILAGVQATVIIGSLAYITKVSLDARKEAKYATDVSIRTWEDLNRAVTEAD